MITVKASDVTRMAGDAPIMSPEQIAALRHEAEQRREEERAASKARKEKMLKLEEEARKQVAGHA